MQHTGSSRGARGAGGARGAAAPAPRPRGDEAPGTRTRVCGTRKSRHLQVTHKHICASQTDTTGKGNHRGRPTWGATASPHAQGPRSLADQSGACLQAAGRSLLGPGDNAVELPRPGQTGPLPRRKAPGIPSMKDSIGLNPHPETLRDYRSKPTIIQLVNHIRT